MKKRYLCLILASICTFGIMGCSNGATPGDTTVIPTETPTETPAATATPTPTEVYVEYSKIKVNETVTHQTWDSFGGSGCWWSQYVGGWDEPNKYSGEVSPREAIAQLLFNKETGIGLTSYRYNVGAGSADSGKGSYTDPHRRTQSFETSAGVYDWSKDANAVWFVKRATEITEGNIDIVLFCNSPLERLTKSGTAQSLKGSTTNIDPSKYGEFADYVFDVAEHFIEMGIPVTEISPINEPQWEWTPGNQEGMHLDSQHIVGILETFVTKIGERNKLTGVRISSPESGEWGGETRNYVNAMMRSSILKNYFTALDIHSYWTNASTKEAFKLWADKNYPDLELRMSEWCEMVNGSDYTMDSAFNMADVIMEDLKILDVTSWQNWVLVAPGGYRDGLIYVNESKQAYRAAKRLWGYGNFTRFIRPGYVRVDVTTPYSDIYNLGSVAFTGVNDKGEKELIVVLTNEENEKTFRMALTSDNTYNYYEVYHTNENRDLELTASGEYNEKTAISIEGQSIVTIRLTAK